MNREQARRRVSALVRSEGFVPTYTGHVKERMGRRGIVNLEILYVLKTGAVVEQPAWNDRIENWECAVEGPDPEGRRLRVVVGFSELKPELVIITVWKKA